MRQTGSASILADLRVALDGDAAHLSRKSEMGKALAYIRARWDGLIRFAGDGHVEMDTNLVENAIRPLALSRKTALFAGEEGSGDGPVDRHPRRKTRAGGHGRGSLRSSAPAG